jgi:hypothetical protein
MVGVVGGVAYDEIILAFFLGVEWGAVGGEFMGALEDRIGSGDGGDLSDSVDLGAVDRTGG